MASINDWRNPSSGKRLLLICGSLIFCILVLTRYQVLAGFSMLSGDRYDAVISTTILEHWFRFFLGDVNWTDVGYYFPYKNSIANTDAYLLNGLAYLPFRFIGLDIFISAELSNLVIKSVGFLGAYLLCRKVFSFGGYWSLLAAILFTLSNGMTVHSSRIQLATVAFFPVMALMLWSMSTAFLAGNLWRFRAYGILAGVFYGAWCLTCFYMAWFFALFTAVFACVIVFSVGDYRAIKEKFIDHWGSVIFVLISAVVSLLPFFYVFIPKARETGVRVYDEALQWTVPLEGILQVGMENFLWGRLYNFLLTYISPGYIPVGEYYNTGFAIGIFALFLFGCVQIVRHREDRCASSANAIIWSLAITTIITLMLVLNISGKSAWYYIFHLFPGAKALRVVSAYLIFLALPVVIIAVKYLSTRRLGLVTVLVASALLVAEEFNSPSLALDRDAELKRISLHSLPPEECRAFYVSGWSGQENLGAVGDLYAHNVTAMLIAQFVGIPTINGIASFNPPGVDFSRPNSSDYEKRIFHYAKKNRISNICKLDLNTKDWSVVRAADIDLANMHVPFFSGDNWGGRVFDVHGLSNFESWGAWSTSKMVDFEFNMPLPERFSLHLIARAFGSNIGEDFEAHVGDSVAKFKFTGADDEKKLIFFDNPGRSNILRIRVPAPISPKALSKGQSTDDRSLGIGFVEMKVVPSSE